MIQAAAFLVGKSGILRPSDLVGSRFEGAVPPSSGDFHVSNFWGGIGCRDDHLPPLLVARTRWLQLRLLCGWLKL